MNQGSRRAYSTIMVFLAIGLAAALPLSQAAAAPAAHNNNGNGSPIQVGYVIVTPDEPSSDLTVFETFGERHGGQTLQAGVLPSSMTTHAVLFVNASGRLSRNVGVAIANPGPNDAQIGMMLYDDQGALLAGYESSNSPIVVPAGGQVAKYVTELFDSRPEVPKDFTGTLDLTSDVPFAVIGIRARGENFSTLPSTSLSGPIEVPSMGDIGGEGAIILAHFASGGGWATELVIANAGDSDITVRVDLFDQTGGPLEATLNGMTGSSFQGITVPGHGVVTLAPRDGKGDSDF
jgi:hypothetical protein